MDNRRLAREDAWWPTPALYIVWFRQWGESPAPHLVAAVGCTQARGSHHHNRGCACGIRALPCRLHACTSGRRQDSTTAVGLPCHASRRSLPCTHPPWRGQYSAGPCMAWLHMAAWQPIITGQCPLGCDHHQPNVAASGQRQDWQARLLPPRKAQTTVRATGSST